MQGPVCTWQKPSQRYNQGRLVTLSTAMAFMSSTTPSSGLVAISGKLLSGKLSLK